MSGPGGAERAAENPQERKDVSLIGRSLEDLYLERDSLYNLDHTFRMQMDRLGTGGRVRFGSSLAIDDLLIRARGHLRVFAEEMTGRLHRVEGEIDRRLVDKALSYEDRFIELRQQVEMLETHPKDVPAAILSDLLTARKAELIALEGEPNSDLRLKRGLQLLAEQRGKEAREAQEIAKVRPTVVPEVPEITEIPEAATPPPISTPKPPEAPPIEPLVFPKGEGVQISGKLRGIIEAFLPTWQNEYITWREWAERAYAKEISEGVSLEAVEQRLDNFRPKILKLLEDMGYRIGEIKVTTEKETKVGLRTIIYKKYRLEAKEEPVKPPEEIVTQKPPEVQLPTMVTIEQPSERDGEKREGEVGET